MMHLLHKGFHSFFFVIHASQKRLDFSAYDASPVIASTLWKFVVSPEMDALVVVYHGDPAGGAWLGFDTKAFLRFSEPLGSVSI